MPDQIEIRSANWVLRLPADWTGGEDQERGFQFESADGGKGLYIATHNVRSHHAGTVEELAEWFVAADLATLDRMGGYAWTTLERSLVPAGGGCVALLDCLAPAQHYRVVAKILARPGQVVRASFHDYQWRAQAASNAYFAPILASLRFAAPGAGARCH